MKGFILIFLMSVKVWKSTFSKQNGSLQIWLRKPSSGSLLIFIVDNSESFGRSDTDDSTWCGLSLPLVGHLISCLNVEFLWRTWGYLIFFILSLLSWHRMTLIYNNGTRVKGHVLNLIKSPVILATIFSRWRTQDMLALLDWVPCFFLAEQCTGPTWYEKCYK